MNKADKTGDVLHVGDVVWEALDGTHRHWSLGYDSEHACVGSSAWARVRPMYVERLTARGAWLRDTPPGASILGERVLYLPGKSRRFAPTPIEAVELRVRRRSAHVRCARRRLDEAEQRLAALRQLAVETGPQGAP